LYFYFIDNKEQTNKQGDQVDGDRKIYTEARSYQNYGSKVGS